LVSAILAIDNMCYWYSSSSIAHEQSVKSSMRHHVLSHFYVACIQMHLVLLWLFLLFRIDETFNVLLNNRCETVWEGVDCESWRNSMPSDAHST